MRRFFCVVVSTVLVSGLFVLGSPSARADNYTCAGTGTMTLTAGFGTFPVVPQRNATFTISFSPTTETCTGIAPPTTITGSLTGWCGFATGANLPQATHNFLAAWSGGTLELHGQITGTFVGVTEDPLNAQSCLAGDETTFTVPVELVTVRHLPI